MATVRQMTLTDLGNGPQFVPEENCLLVTTIKSGNSFDTTFSHYIDRGTGQADSEVLEQRPVDAAAALKIAQDLATKHNIPKIIVNDRSAL